MGGVEETHHVVGGGVGGLGGEISVEEMHGLLGAVAGHHRLGKGAAGDGLLEGATHDA